jgi:heme-degrading monooxygenase HmoA
MYGTIARLRIKPGMEAELERLSREANAEIPGFTFQHVYRTDADPQELYLVVGFATKEAYRANAESPEQHARYETYRTLLAAEPEWHDGEIVFSVHG